MCYIQVLITCVNYRCYTLYSVTIMYLGVICGDVLNCAMNLGACPNSSAQVGRAYLNTRTWVRIHLPKLSPPRINYPHLKKHWTPRYTKRINTHSVLSRRIAISKRQPTGTLEFGQAPRFIVLLNSTKEHRKTTKHNARPYLTAGRCLRYFYTGPPTTHVQYLLRYTFYYLQYHCDLPLSFVVLSTVFYCTTPFLL